MWPNHQVTAHEEPQQKLSGWERCFSQTQLSECLLILSTKHIQFFNVVVLVWNSRWWKNET